MIYFSQIVCLIYAFISIGVTTSKDNSNFDKMLSLVGFIVSIILVLTIQVVLID